MNFSKSAIDEFPNFKIPLTALHITPHSPNPFSGKSVFAALVLSVGTMLAPTCYCLIPDMSAKDKSTKEVKPKKPAPSKLSSQKKLALESPSGESPRVRSQGVSSADEQESPMTPYYRTRSNSQSDRNVIASSTLNKTPNQSGLLHASLLSQTGVSPLAVPLSDGETGNSSDSQVQPKSNKKTCPCKATSGGKSWYLKCSHCGQCWHNRCANLRGN